MTQQNRPSTFYVRDGLGRVRGPYPLAFVLRLATCAEGEAFEVSRDGVKFARLVDEPSIRGALGAKAAVETPAPGVAPVSQELLLARRRADLRTMLDRWKRLSAFEVLGVTEAIDGLGADAALLRLLRRFGLEKPEAEQDDAIRGLKRALWSRAAEAHHAVRYREVEPIAKIAEIVRGG